MQMIINKIIPLQNRQPNEEFKSYKFMKFFKFLLYKFIEIQTNYKILIRESFKKYDKLQFIISI